MNKELKYKLYASGECVPEEMLFRYIDQQLNPKEQHAVEKHLLDCELCSDALEGLSELKNRDRIGMIREQAAQRLAAPEKRIIRFSYRAAVSVAAGILLLAGGVFFFNQFTSKEMMSGDMAVLEEKSSPAEQAPPPPPADEAGSVKGPHQETVTANAEEQKADEPASAEGSGAGPDFAENNRTAVTHEMVAEDLKTGIQAEPLTLTKKEAKEEENSKYGYTSNYSLSQQNTNTIVIADKLSEKDLSKQMESPQPTAAGATYELSTAEKSSTTRKETQDSDLQKKGKKNAEKLEFYSSPKKDQDVKAPAAAPQSGDIANKQETGAKDANRNAEQRADHVTMSETEDVTVLSKLSVTDDIPEKKSGEHVYTIADEMPEFPGGQAGLSKYVLQNYRLRATGKEASVADVEESVQRKTIIEFIVDEEGKVTDAKVIKGIDPASDKEALRLVNEMPKWKPGRLNGKSVKVKMALPIPVATE